ncbi:MAG TPA: hypothetical protein VI968_04605 [archaeon]|nr:hypothetical protein [archaeon]
MARKTRRSRSSKRGVRVTRAHAFGSIVILLAGIISVAGLAAYSGIVTPSNSVGYATNYGSGMQCFKACIDPCSVASDVSTCLDSKIYECRSQCNI